MKRTAAVILALLIAVISAVSVSAEANYGGLNEFDKSSRSDFNGQGGLTMTTQSLETFDSLDTEHYKYDPNVTLDSSNKKQGSSSIKLSASDGDVGDYSTNSMLSRHVIFETKSANFSVDVPDIHKMTIGMWFYIDNADNLPCDHDFVYNYRQENCATLYFRFGSSDANYQQWNHTIEGSGWHYIEFDFSTKENTNSDWRNDIIYNSMRYMWLMVMTGGMPVTVNVDEISLITYSTSAETPECPNNGRWISTCDYDILDGSTVTEWLGAYYDPDEKTQGSSSVTVRGRKEHVDYREVFCGYNMDIDVKNDVFCFDVYVEDKKLLGSDWTFSFYSMDESESLQADYTLLISNTITNDGLFSNGWNTVQIPFSAMKASSKDGITNFTMARLKIFCKGASETEYYTIKYDNMYVAQKGNIDNSKISAATASGSGDYLAAQNASSDVQVEDEGGLDTTVIIAVGAVGGAVLLVVIFLIIALSMKKKKAASAPAAAPAKAPVKPKAEPKEKTEDKNKKPDGGDKKPEDK